MKKLILITICLFVLSGCGQKEYIEITAEQEKHPEYQERLKKYISRCKEVFENELNLENKKYSMISPHLTHGFRCNYDCWFEMYNQEETENALLERKDFEEIKFNLK